MRQKFMKATKVFFSLLLSVSLILSTLTVNMAFAFISNSGSTRIIHNQEREIGKGVVLAEWQGITSAGKPKAGHTITFNPVTSDAQILTAFGDSVNSRVTLSTSSMKVEQEGVSVIGGINGDFYYLETGIPIGIMIKDGRLVSYSSTEWNAIGFKKDGSVVIGRRPDLEMKFTVNGKSYAFGNLNKTQGDWGPYLYTADYGSTTGSTVPSLEVILDIEEGEPAIGRPLVAKVADIRLNAKATPIGPNQLVLSARNDKTGYYAISQLRMGDVVLFEITDKTGEWEGVQQAIGGEKILIDNGAIVSGLSSSNYNPATAIGVKANGDVVLYQIDGRSSVSQGASSLEVAQFLYDLGCVEAIQLDGGGSSAIIARKPGYRSPGLLNSPSDGKERANSNSILLVSKRSIEIKDGTAEAGKEAKKLHMYPFKGYALPGATVEYSLLATDEYYFPTEVPKEVTWMSNAGEFDSSGKLTITGNPGAYPVMVASDKAMGSGQIVVLSEVTSLKPAKSVVNVQPGESVDLSCVAYYYNIPVASSDKSFTWKVEGNIGTINEEGVFTASPDAKDKGRVVVSYGKTTAYIDIVFPGSPDTIEDFENGITWGASFERAKSASASVIEDPSKAKSGSKILKVDYDFTLAQGVEAGIAGAYAFRVDPNTGNPAGITLDKAPAAIGMWVYGDNSKAWLRAQLKDGKGQRFNIDFTKEYNPATGTGGIDWTGWKYVEAEIPSGKTGPFVLETPIRIMTTRDDLRTKGTLYFDQIRAVYTAGSKDTQAPVLSVPSITEIINTNKVSLKATLSDDRSGVDVTSIKVHLDGVLLPVTTTVNTDGTVVLEHQLGAELPLADGMHRLTFEYSDFLGNKDIKNITFTVDTGAPQITAVTSGSVVEEGTFTTELGVKNPKTLRKVYMKFSFDPSRVEVVDADPSKPGKQIALEAGVKKGKVITHLVDEVNGTITLEIDNLTNFSQDSTAKFGTITFKAKKTFGDSTKTGMVLGAMIVGSNPASQRFVLPEMQTNLVYDYTLTVQGTKAGERTIFTCTDSNGNPVTKAGIYMEGTAAPFFETGEDGKASTGILTLLPTGTELTFRAMKDGKKSNPVKIVITE